MDIKFNDFALEIKDYFIMDNSGLIVVDMTVSPDFFHKELKPFIYDHQDDESRFDFKIDNQDFFGRFGKLTFDKKGNVQFFITTTILERINPHTMTSMVVSKRSSQYVNMLQLIKTHEKNFDLLENLLVSKDIISEQELPFFKSPLELKDISDFSNEVESLPTFLKETYGTIAEIKNSSKD